MKSASYLTPFAAIALLTVPTIAEPCAVASIDPVKMADQENIVVYDSKSGTEHFIRRAKFNGESAAFFIAPTPAVPELAEVDALAFSIARKHLRNKGQLSVTKAASNSAASLDSAPAFSIEQRVNVAGYDAITLRIDQDPTAAIAFLKKEGFPVSADLSQWFDFYVKNKWVLTAFRVDLKGNRKSTGMIRMSFKTRRPFNPYYVPAGNRAGGSLLRIVTVTRNDSAFTLNGKPWLEPELEGVMTGESAADFSKSLKLPELDTTGWQLRGYTDNSFASVEAGDLYLSEQSWAPIDLVVGFGGLGALAIGMFFFERRLRTQARLSGNPV